jgi:hypothetical protein
MTDADLKKQLSALPAVSAADPALRERALHRSLIALAQPREAEEVGATRSSTGSPTWRVVLAALVVVFVAGALVFRSGHFRATENETNAHADLQTLAQVQELFPDRLNAVIERDGALELDLSNRPQSGATEQPLIVQLVRGDQRLRVLSYSGRSITLELKGVKFTFEALVTSDGGIVLSGNDFVWNSKQPGPLAGYRVIAQPLNIAL